MVDEITPAELAERLEDGDEVQVVDIRGRRKYDRGHIPGAINLPFAHLPQEMADVDWEDEIVVACPLGQSSRQAARLIQSYEGVDDDARVLNLEGGYDAWEADLEQRDSDTGSASEAPW
ncbi:rhodanese-like domain-containing protein [Halobacteriales archaeon QS_1_68_20]|nr:MAG: rhodanese-like domain-containing protein [Halobacteriales archaeon QS_1_68_20]